MPTDQGPRMSASLCCCGSFGSSETTFSATGSVVASPLEIARIRKECGRGFLIVTPGVRMARSSWDDQKRVLTPEQAIQAGADYIVVGKPIRDARDPQAAAREIVMEMERGSAGLRGRSRGDA